MKTDRDHAYEACLTAYDIPPCDLDDDQWASFAKAMNKLVADHGLEAVQHWAADAIAEGVRDLGRGAKPERKIPSVVRREITADGWQAAYGKSRGKPNTSGQKFIHRTDGRKIPEKDWDGDMLAMVNLWRGAEMWDEERGMPTSDSRHPSQAK